MDTQTTAQVPILPKEHDGNSAFAQAGFEVEEWKMSTAPSVPGTLTWNVATLEDVQRKQKRTPTGRDLERLREVREVGACDNCKRQKRRCTHVHRPSPALSGLSPQPTTRSSTPNTRHEGIDLEATGTGDLSSTTERATRLKALAETLWEDLDSEEPALTPFTRSQYDAWMSVTQVDQVAASSALAATIKSLESFAIECRRVLEDPQARQQKTWSRLRRWAIELIPGAAQNAPEAVPWKSATHTTIDDPMQDLGFLLPSQYGTDGSFPSVTLMDQEEPVHHSFVSNRRIDALPKPRPPNSGFDDALRLPPMRLSIDERANAESSSSYAETQNFRGLHGDTSSSAVADDWIEIPGLLNYTPNHRLTSPTRTYAQAARPAFGEPQLQIRPMADLNNTLRPGYIDNTGDVGNLVSRTEIRGHRHSLPGAAMESEYSWSHSPFRSPAPSSAPSRASTASRRTRSARGDNTLSYACPTCSVTFAKPEDLRRHTQRAHAGVSDRPHPCPEPGCQWRFTNPKDVRRHARSHHASEPQLHTCPHCSKSYTRMDNLRRHLKRDHDHESAAFSDSGIGSSSNRSRFSGDG